MPGRTGSVNSDLVHPCNPACFHAVQCGCSVKANILMLVYRHLPRPEGRDFTAHMINYSAVSRLVITGIIYGYKDLSAV